MMPILEDAPANHRLQRQDRRNGPINQESHRQLDKSTPRQPEKRWSESEVDDKYGRLVDISDDEGDPMTKPDEDKFLKQLRVNIQQHVYRCPVRLWDTQRQEFVSREDFAFHIEGEILASGDSRQPNLEEDLPAQVDQHGRYAVLSHRWARGEVLFDDMANLQTTSQKLGYIKFFKFCEVSSRFGCRFIWTDTACINKASSSELDESIRSMYTWYQNAYVCVVYLASAMSESRSSFNMDEWFRRGWTLQELLAPRRVKFFNREWEEVFETAFDICRVETSKKEKAEYIAQDFAQLCISFAADIELNDLQCYQPSPTQACNVFRWMSNRMTTRPEDTAYCLIGLLDVQLPIAYGEGLERSFYRLQVECAQYAEDRSLFAWRGIPSKWSSMLAREPEVFNTMRGIVSSHCLFRRHLNPASSSSSSISIDPSFAFTNCGLRIMVTLYDLDLISRGSTTYMNAFRCSMITENDTEFDLDDGEASLLLITGGLGPVDAAEDQMNNGDTHQQQQQCKIGILGVRNDWPFAVLLRQDDEKSPPRYTRIASAYFRVLPPIEELVTKPPQTIFIE